MAYQDNLFPLLPRNTQVGVGERHLRVKRIEKKPRAHAVQEEDLGDVTQEARVQNYMQHKHGSVEDKPDENQATHTLPDEDPVAEDPRKKHIEHTDDDHKGIHLDTYV